MDTPQTGNGQATRDDRPVGELVRQAAEQTATLVRDELRLAQLELQEKGRHAGLGAGMFGGAGLVAFYAGGALIAGVILLLATAVDPWVAALIVAAVLFTAAGILALTGKKQIDQATPPAPKRTQASVKRDVHHVKERASK